MPIRPWPKLWGKRRMRRRAPRYTPDMATEVVMPQMGESVAEGTSVRWIKKVGDKVDRDEPLLEISTDKVDAEMPAPAAGVVSEIRVMECETVPGNSLVAVIVAAAAGEPGGRLLTPPVASRQAT